MADCAAGTYWVFTALGDIDCAGGVCRYFAADGVCGDARCMAAGDLSDPRHAWRMLNKLSDFAATLPRRYPALMDQGIN